MPDDSDDEPPKRRGGFRMDQTITLGNVLQILVMAGGAAMWLISSGNRSEQAGRDIIVLQDRLTTQITDLRGTVTSGMSDVRAQIATLPDQRAMLDQSQRRLTDVEQRYNLVNSRLDTIGQMAIECRADLNTILRQANVSLPNKAR